jgi:RNase P protein component
MHTSRTLSSDAFEIRVDGGRATVADLLPGFDEHARLGIVVSKNGAAAGASTLILAAVTAFYDRLRATEADFFAYPDYFAFHVGERRGSLRKLDVFPEHKEPVVADDAEEVLRAINDRGVTHLLVPEGAPRPVALGRDTRHSARRRIRTAIAYAPSGRVPGGEIAVTAAPQAEEFVSAMLGDGPRDVVGEDGRPRETFRRVRLDDALGMLESSPDTLRPRPSPNSVRG